MLLPQPSQRQRSLEAGLCESNDMLQISWRSNSLVVEPYRADLKTGKLAIEDTLKPGRSGDD